MAKKITYLLGAGASANVIPIVGFMHQRIMEVTEYLKSYHSPDSIMIKPNKIPKDKVEVLNDIITELEWLINKAGIYHTIDTLAKKYYLTDNHNDLKRLKKSLIIYFTLEQFLNIKSATNDINDEQFIKHAIDKRYASFIAAITDKTYRLPGNNPDAQAYENLPFELNRHIKVLSWNYDIQFELSIQSFLTRTIIQHVKNEFLILPNDKSKDEVNNSIIESNRFGMVKLNGDAVWSKLFNEGFKHTIFDSRKDIDEKELLIEFLEAYISGNIAKGILNSTDINPISCFNFAWENDVNFRDKYRGHRKNLEAAELIASETEILVVIGYSFPIFNREIDNLLFKNMKKLEKVYIQDKEPEKIKSTMQNAFEILQRKERTQMITDYTIAEQDLVKFHFDTNINQFIIPYGGCKLNCVKIHK